MASTEWEREKERLAKEGLGKDDSITIIRKPGQDSGKQSVLDVPQEMDVPKKGGRQND